MPRKKKSSTPDLTKEFIGPIQPNYRAYTPQDHCAPPTSAGQQEELVPNAGEKDNKRSFWQRSRKKESHSRTEEYTQASSGLTPDGGEQRYVKGQRGRLLFRGILIVLNFALLAYLAYGVTTAIRDLVTDKRVTAESYITLCGRSKQNSKKIYDRYLEDGKGKIIADYALNGDSLYLSGLRISSANLTSFDSLHIANVCADDIALVPIVKGDLSVDLSSLASGSYLVFPDKGSSSILGRLNLHRALKEDYYLPPSAAGVRKKITLRNNEASPALVLEVADVSSLPADHFDIAFLTADAALIPDLDPALRAKVCTVEEGYSCVYQAEPIWAFDLTGTQNISPYHSTDFPSFSRSPLAVEGLFKGLDSTSFIREMGGYLTGGGSCLDSLTCLVTPYLSEVHRGSQAFVVDAKGDIKQAVEEIVATF